MRRFALLALACGLALHEPSRAAEGGATAGFRNWSVACDNVRACTAIGFAENAGAEAGPHIYITREAGAGARAEVEIGLGYSDAMGALKNGDRLQVVVEGASTLQIPVTVRRGAGSYEWPEIHLPADRAEAFVAALGQGSRVTVKSGDKVLGAVSLDGSSAALRWIDDQQKRAGTVTALVAKGPKPASAVPSAPPLPVVRLAAAVSQEGVPDAPAALLADERVKTCADEYDADADRVPSAVRLSATEYLWYVPCGSGAYNFTTLFLISRADGSGLRGAGFDLDEPDMLINANYDPRTRLLDSFYKGRGLGDCGSEAQWAWDGTAFRLVLLRQMTDCLGVTSEHWPVVWRARTQG